MTIREALRLCHSTVARGALAAALLAAPAMAQETAPQADAPNESASSGGIADIVVTAQYREQRLQDTPISITAVDSSMITARSQTNLAEIAAQAPNVQLQPMAGAFGPSIAASIRGIGQADFNPAFEPGVGMYLDDVYYPRLTGANFDLLDVERVEILRGPQGTLTGRNSEGGAIRFISRKPTGANEGYVMGTYGSRNRVDLRGSYDLGLSDSLSMRLAGTWRKQDGYVDVYDYGCVHPGGGIAATGKADGDCKLGDQGDANYWAVKGMLRFQPSDNFDLMITADYVKNNQSLTGDVVRYANLDNPNTNPAPGVPYDSRFICGPYCNYSTFFAPAAVWAGPVAPGYPLYKTQFENKMLYEGWGLASNMVINLGDSATFTNILAYRTWDTEFGVDNDLSPAFINGGYNKLHHWFWSEEARLNASLTDKVEFTLGFYYSKELTNYYTIQEIRYSVIPLQFIGDDPVRSRSTAVFGTVIIKPTDALTLTGGFRFTDETKSYTFVRKNLDGVTTNPFVGSLDGQTFTYSGNRVDYRASVDYRFTPEVLAYATVATGFKGGGVGPRPFNAEQAQPFNPEVLTNYEVGLKTDLFDRHVRANASLFYNKFKDIQLTLLSCPQFGGPGPCALPQNAGEATIKGAEFELLATFGGFTLDGSVSHLNFRFDCVNPQVVGQPLGPCSTDPGVVGLLNQGNGFPKWKWSLGAQYRAELGGGQSVTPRFDLSYMGSREPSGLSNPALHDYLVNDSYLLGNARVTYSNENLGLDVSLEVTNIFDKYYYLGSFDLTGAGAGIITGTPGRPREWAVTLKKTF